MHPVPKRIRLAAGNDSLSVEWSDGHTSFYGYRTLRDRCPCAMCSDLPHAQTAAPTPFPMFGAKALKPERAEVVGRYALQIFWNDGHSSGIYGFDLLRSLCPCAECAKVSTP